MKNPVVKVDGGFSSYAKAHGKAWKNTITEKNMYTDVWGNRQNRRDLRTASSKTRQHWDKEKHAFVDNKTTERAMLKEQAKRQSEHEELFNAIQEANRLGIDLSDMRMDLGGFYVYDDAKMGELAKAIQDEMDFARDMEEQGMLAQNIVLSDGESYAYHTDRETLEDRDRLYQTLEKLRAYYSGK